MNTNTLSVGMKVWFGRSHGEQTLGTIQKVNRQTVAVRQDEARGTMRTYPVGTIWKVPHRLCRVADQQATQNTVQTAAPAAPKAARPEAHILREIQNCYCSLSPENLYCDGERSHTAAMRVARTLKAQLKSLFRELGREVSEDEAYRLTLPRFY